MVKTCWTRFPFCLFLPWNSLLLPVAGKWFPSFCSDFPICRGTISNFLCASEWVFQKGFFSCPLWFSWSYKVFGKLFSNQVSVIPLQQICFLPQHFFGLWCWAVEGCKNVIPSKICNVSTALAQKEHCFLNICSRIIQSIGYLLFFGSTLLLH